MDFGRLKGPKCGAHPLSSFKGFLLFSQSHRYFSYPSLYSGDTLLEKMSSPRGLFEGGIGASGMDCEREVMGKRERSAEV